jgi:hypothetical protein
MPIAERHTMNVFSETSHVSLWLHYLLQQRQKTDFSVREGLVPQRIVKRDMALRGV